MADIIVVDDETDVAFMIADYLQAKGYRIRTASGGAELREAIATATADLVVLDINMPGENGFSLARWLREHHDTGILMLTGADSVFDKVAGLEVGADDYLAKPFAPVELEARIAAVLRRRRPKGSNDADTLPAGHFAFGTYVFDARVRNLIDVDGVAIPLTPMELDLVAAFAARPGQVIGRDELLDLAPPRGDEPFDRSIDSRITRLRRRLEKDPAKPELIKTIRRVGYLYPRR
ncbi:response regulator transcription factor [Mesorhizobium sp.]|uniref:response regulator transcription factor n=1 Tax=Mesorhizobium sp. TaxID=1871066 RepID=UPI0011F68ABB|nr:response regulator transcription factor [Mesorhizobium sp.]TIO08300.1 MAG: response regulator transcription factor [Mesorhizobium sp.]TIO29792.1 MAG: response regulator transcription factor [Mesorhizobium sp.]TIP07971.1 MAG: response regulator transcription factor [Mesorhizobium sp.]